MTDTADSATILRRQITPDRFEVLTDPIGWRCLSCRAEVRSSSEDRTEVERLAETAADHALYCGRCDD